ncbi:hypothetical protein [Mariniblastus fucicola]|uniref:Uncharacterized protein n=1 Tax=Mariniblastus fucicola TaxID=980251 RepID=A0A5B9PAP5_9BACT|nr:hypothetical protein [Mariniblastus fucicola]QEG20163.1 hypothetical protein MFFC18_00100 [Mariniblastus fucicola]
MRSKSNGTKSKRRARSQKSAMSYGALEARNLLATLVEFNAVDSQISVNMDANNDIAVIGIADNGNVTVNGSQDLDGKTSGVQSVEAGSLKHIFVSGDVNRTAQEFSFVNDFTPERALYSVQLQNVSQITINGQLNVRENFLVSMNGQGGRIGDSTSGQLVVGGLTKIDAGANTVGLNNANNDFSELYVGTSGKLHNAVITDINDVMLTGVETSGNFTLTAGGDVEDVANAKIEVAEDAFFTAKSITLGDHEGDSTNFFRSSFNASGHVEVQEDSNMILIDSEAGSMTLRSVGVIQDGLRTTINVSGLAQFFGNNRVRIGEGGLDTFNAGSIQFQSNGHVHISENSDTVITGDNSASSLNIKSWGRVGDFVGTTINVANETGLEGISVVLGDSATDVFNTGSMYFWTSELFSVNEDSNSHIIETKNRAGDFQLQSAGSITDADDSRITVDGVANFKANNVNVGDSQDDWFVAGSVSFETSGQFKLSENSDLQIVGENSAAKSVINSSGNITNDVNAKVDVRNSAAFFADNIVLGNRSGDQFNAGTIGFRTADDANGLVQIEEDSHTNVGGNNVAKTLQIDSAGDITDGPKSIINVSGNTRFTTANNGRIVVGDSGYMSDGTRYDAAFETRTLTVQSDGTGNVVVEEDGDIVLKGDNRANSMSLMTLGAEGKILDTPETTLAVRYNLNVEGSLINLGTDVLPNGSSTDRLEFASLTFNSTGNVKLSADDSFFLTGSSTTGGFLTLESEGDIRSTSGSELLTEAGAQFDGMDILVGNLADDCFDIIDSFEDGTKRLLVNGEGIENVQLGCSAGGDSGVDS